MGVFLPFAPDHEFTPFEVDVVAVQTRQFTDAEAGTEQQFQDGPIALAAERLQIWLRQQPRQLVFVQKGDLRPPHVC